jgi:non-homologous end joining protein Ku
MAEPRYKVVNGEYIELTAEELQELKTEPQQRILIFKWSERT